MTEHAMNPDEPLKENTQGIMRLFVYGTLKRGFWNHDRFCRGVLDVREAVVRGCLYEMQSGILVLQVPDGDVLAQGTTDPLADVATQARLSEQLASYPEPALDSATTGDWGRVFGELLTFDDPETRLPATCLPAGRSTAWRGSVRAGPAYTIGSSSLSAQIDSIFRLGSIWWGIAAQKVSENYPTASGAKSSADRQGKLETMASKPPGKTTKKRCLTLTDEGYLCIFLSVFVGFGRYSTDLPVLPLVKQAETVKEE